MTNVAEGVIEIHLDDGLVQMFVTEVSVGGMYSSFNTFDHTTP